MQFDVRIDQSNCASENLTPHLHGMERKHEGYKYERKFCLLH